ncbi:hypothetical protein BSZ35_04095 [Salinibacter sp. 10B]|nr:hypothetical protein BSZ35_04095 [Salinibacter sp. 10B]
MKPPLVYLQKNSGFLPVAARVDLALHQRLPDLVFNLGPRKGVLRPFLLRKSESVSPNRGKRYNRDADVHLLAFGMW